MGSGSLTLVDWAGTVHARAAPGARIVSLVPSITELLCDLGLANQLVGRTGFCIHPHEQLRSIAKVGGTETVKVDRIRQLSPTHLIVNVDENRLETVKQLAHVGMLSMFVKPSLTGARGVVRGCGRGSAS